MKEKIIQQGAEAILLQRGSHLVKRRIAKGYRLEELDKKLRRRRTRREGKLLVKAGQLLPTPTLAETNDSSQEIVMDYIEGKKLSDHLDTLKNWKDVCLMIGTQIALLHDSNIIHGDLTTSNMIYSEKERKLYFIDYGLGFVSSRIEDKAVDLHLIKQALEAQHYEKFEEYFSAVLKGYVSSQHSEKTLAQFKKVEKRGRYKSQY